MPLIDPDSILTVTLMIQTPLNRDVTGMSGGGFAISSPPAQATTYEPADRHFIRSPNTSTNNHPNLSSNADQTSRALAVGLT